MEPKESTKIRDKPGIRKTIKKKLSKTRNIILLAAIGMVVFYALADIVFGFLHTGDYSVAQFDATLTSEWFSFWKWVVSVGGGITVAKTLKGNTNSDDDETDLPTSGRVV